MNRRRNFKSIVLLISLTGLLFFSCKTKKHTQAVIETQIGDTLDKCRLQFKTAKNLSRHIKDNELKFDWINAKADVEATAKCFWELRKRGI
jgi:hypothetical protein